MELRIQGLRKWDLRGYRLRDKDLGLGFTGASKSLRSHPGCVPADNVVC